MHGGDTFYMYLMLKFIYREGAESNELKKLVNSWLVI